MPLGEAAAVLNAVAWAATGVTAKALGAAVRPYHVITAHTLVATLAFIVIAAATGNLSAMAETPAAALGLFAAAAVLNTAGSFIFFTAVSTGTVGGTYTTTTGLYVLMSLVAGAVFLDERIAPLAGVGAAAIVTGVYVLNGPGRVRAKGREKGPSAPGPVRRTIRSRVFTGLGLGVATAVLWTLGLLVLKWGLARSDVITAAFMRNVVAAAIYAGAGVFLGRQKAIPRATRNDWSWLLLSAGFFTASTYLWNYALANTDAGKTAVLASTAPVFALAMAVVFLRERLSVLAVGGVAVALGGTLLVVMAK